MDYTAQKTQILLEGLKNVPFDGWTLSTFENAAEKAGLDKALVLALFPRGERDLMVYFAQWADAEMMAALKTIKPDDLKIRARVRMAVEKRIEILMPHKECVNACFKKMMMPQNARIGASITWQTSDVIWTWAGDTSTDYNKYTKRGLLSGVIASTMAYWLQDNSDNGEKTRDFLNNRIENVLFIGKNTSKIITPIESVIKNFIMPNIKAKTGKI